MSLRFAGKFARGGAAAKSARALELQAVREEQGGDGEEDRGGSEVAAAGDSEAAEAAAREQSGVAAVGTLDEDGCSGPWLLPMEKRASWLSRLVFWWFVPVLRRGYRCTLTPANLEGVEPKDEPQMLYDKFQALWQAEVSGLDSGPAGRRPNMLRVMVGTVGRGQLALGFALSVVQAACLSSVPFVSKRLLEILSQVDGQAQSVTEEAWLAAGLAVLPLVAALAQAALTFLSRRGSMHLYIALTQAIFNKSLRLSSASRNSSSSGQLVNLIATDAGTALERAVLLIYPLFLAPPLLGVLLYLISREVGLSLLAGFACMVLALPANLRIFMGLTKVYEQTIGLADDRIKLVNEALQAVRVLKMYAWEAPFMAKINAMRERELVFLRKHAFLFAVGLNAIYLQLPYLIQFCTFAAFYLTGNPFYPWVIFTAIQLFQQVQQQLTQLPSAISQLSQSTVAARRIADFLLLPELDSLQEPHDDDDGKSAHADALVSLEQASFTWDVVPDGLGLEEEKALGPQADAQIAGDAGDSNSGEGDSGNKRKGRPTKRGLSVFKRGLSLSKRMPDPEAASAQASTLSVQALSAKQSSMDLCALKGLDLAVRAGERVAVIGRVASGKSSLLLSLTGELRRCEGRSRVRGSLAYAAQTPFVLSCSLRDNVLFGQRFDAALYAAVLDACCLLPDLAVMPDGDQTFIGERGVNLSGGQKARVALARAVYAQADVTLLDDPLSAVDAHVGAAIMDKCIFGPLLKGRAVVFTTNKLERLADFHQVVLLDGGRIAQQGRWGVDVVVGEQDLVDEEAAAASASSPSEPDSARPDSNLSEVSASNQASHVAAAADECKASGNDKDPADAGAEEADKLYKEEEEASGTLKLSVLLFLIKATGRALFASAYGLYVFYLFTPLFAQYMLSSWTDEQLCESGLSADADCAARSRGQTFWFRLYCAILFSGLLVCVAAGFLIAQSRVAASRNLHNELVATAFGASVTEFFDVHPMGRVLNRFAKDMSIIDFPLSQMGMFAVVVLVYALSAFVGVSLGTSGLFALALVPVLGLYVALYSYTRTTAVQLQRLEARARSPIYSNFSEVLNGLKTIRGFAQQESFVLRNRASLTENVAAYFLARVALPAAQMVLVNVLGTLVMVLVICFVLLTDQVAPGEAGLAISYALTISQTMNAVVFVCTDFEISMNAVERVKQFVDDVQPEDPAAAPPSKLKRPPRHPRDDAAANNPKELARVVVQPDRPQLAPDWPATGQVQLSELVVGYRDGPDVLHGVSASVAPAEKLGVCGRTGSGKSTLMLALLRIVEPRRGAILIDGVDIAAVSLHDLRSRIAIIPQTPVVFQDSLRFNVDPLGNHSDAALSDALRAVGLDHLSLDLELVEGGDNVSEGQRQLICFVRAILRKSRVLLLDEATAMADDQTDKHLQQLILKEFHDRTVITVAHRLKPLCESTRVMVLDYGNIVEFDTPQALLADPNSAFAKMLQAENNASNTSTNEAADQTS